MTYYSIIPSSSCSKNDCDICIRSCAIAVDSSNSESVVCVRSESTSSEGSVHHIHLTRDHSSTLFLEYHCIVSDLPITFNALYSTPGHTDTSGGCGGSHITRVASGAVEKSCPPHTSYSPNLRVT